MADSISLDQLQEQQGQLSQTVSNLVAQKATLASNQGALQYANALIQSVEGDGGVSQVGEGNVSQDIEVPAEAQVEEVEAVTL